AGTTDREDLLLLYQRLCASAPLRRCEILLVAGARGGHAIGWIHAYASTTEREDLLLSASLRRRAAARTFLVAVKRGDRVIRWLPASAGTTDREELLPSSLSASAPPRRRAAANISCCG